MLGPCINASGRLDTAARSLKLLCAETEDEAAKLAGDLTALNQSRKALTEEGKEAAIRIVEETEIGQDRVLVIYLRTVMKVWLELLQDVSGKSTINRSCPDKR